MSRDKVLSCEDAYI